VHALLPIIKEPVVTGRENATAVAGTSSRQYQCKGFVKTDGSMVNAEAASQFVVSRATLTAERAVPSVLRYSRADHSNQRVHFPAPQQQQQQQQRSASSSFQRGRRYRRAPSSSQADHTEACWTAQLVPKQQLRSASPHRRLPFAATAAEASQFCSRTELHNSQLRERASAA
jgi:hypothetical protein